MSSPLLDTMAASDLDCADFAQAVAPFSDLESGTTISPIGVSSDSLKNAIVFRDEDLTDKTPLGSGGFGTVYRYRWKSPERSMQFVAEKQFVTTEHLKKESEKALRQEVTILGSLNHPHIIKLLGILYGKGNYFSFIMEYLEHGSCCDFFRTSLDGLLQDEKKWPLKYRISLQVSEAMDYLHSYPSRILHLDLKSRNVLLDKRLNVKLCDFGLSQLTTFSRVTQQASKASALTSTDSNSASGARGTITHIAPERLVDLNCKPTTKWDVYSYGIFLWELLTETEPYESNLKPEVLRELLKGLVNRQQRPDRKRIPKSAPEQMKDLMVKCWDGEADERPEFKEIIQKLNKNNPFSDQKTHASVQLVLQKVSSPSQLTQSDSLMVMSPPRKEPFPGTTRSEGLSQAVRRPNQPIRAFSESQDHETAVKKVFGHDTQQTVGSTLSNFQTQRLGVSMVEQPPPSNNTVLTSKDVLISDVTEQPSHDDDPLLVDTTGPIENRRKRRKRFVAFFVFVGVIAIGVAVFLSICFTQGCFASCASLPKRPHQFITCSVSDQSSPSRLSVGSQCHVTCDQGYGIKTGDSQLTCQSNGVWSSEQPNCSELQSCRTLPPPANGGWFNCTDQFYEMSVCSFACPVGSHLHTLGSSKVNRLTRGVTDTPTTTCSKGLVKWSSPEPYCEQVTTCPKLPEVTAGQFDCSQLGQPGSLNDVAYVNGTTCRVKCQAHFGTKDSSTVFCQKDGSWNSTSAPVCMRECSVIPDFNGNFTCTQSLFVTSVCQFTCKPNFVMMGPQRISCMNTGMWTSLPPKCVCPSCRTGTNCDLPLTWVDALRQMNESYNSGKTFKYGDHRIKCYPRVFPAQYLSNVTDDDPTMSCVCRDVPSNVIQQCNMKASLRTVCESSLSSLILKLVFKGKYKLPCDAYLMPPSCEK